MSVRRVINAWRPIFQLDKLGEPDHAASSGSRTVYAFIHCQTKKTMATRIPLKHPSEIVNKFFARKLLERGYVLVGSEVENTLAAAALGALLPAANA